MNFRSIVFVFLFLFTIPYATAVEIHPYFITPKHPVADDKGQHPKGPDCISSFLTELRTVAQDFASSGKVGLQVIVAPEDAVHLFCPQIEFMGDSVNLANSHESNRVSFYEFISKIEGISRGFPNTLFIPGSVVAIDEIPKELLQAADRPGFVFEQEEENFRLEEQHGQKKLVKKVGGVSVAAQGVAQVFAPVILNGELLRLIPKGSPLQKKANKLAVVDFGEDDLDPTLLFWGRELGLPRVHYASIPDHILHSPYFRVATQGAELQFGLQICRDHNHFNLLNPPKRQDYGKVPNKLDVQVIVASGTPPHSPQGKQAVREGGLVIHSDHVANSFHADCRNSTAYPFSIQQKWADLEKVLEPRKHSLFDLESSSFELHPEEGRELLPLVTTDPMRGYAVYDYLQTNDRVGSPSRKEFSVLELGAGLSTEKSGFRFSPETFEIQSLFQNNRLHLQVIDRSAEVLAGVREGHYKIPKQIKGFRNFEGRSLGLPEFTKVLGGAAEIAPGKELHRVFKHHEVSTQQMDFKDLHADHFKEKSYDYIFALNSLWYFLRNHDQAVRTEFVQLLLTHLKPGGQLFIDSDTEALIRDLLPKDRKIEPVSGLLFRVF